MKTFQTFTVYRRNDKSGVSGSGRILDGVIFHNGWVVVCWRTDVDAAKHGHSSLGIFSSWADFKFIHIDAHPENNALVVYGRDANLAEELSKQLHEPGNA